MSQVVRICSCSQLIIWYIKANQFIQETYSIFSIFTVNGTVGEGALMSIDERKSVTEKWMNVAKEFGIFVMVHVGAANMNGVIELVSSLISI